MVRTRWPSCSRKPVSGSLASVISLVRLYLQVKLAGERISET
jgi:hypothetical protein